MKDAFINTKVCTRSHDIVHVKYELERKTNAYVLKRITVKKRPITAIMLAVILIVVTVSSCSKEDPAPAHIMSFPPPSLDLPAPSSTLAEQDGVIIDYGNASGGYTIVTCQPREKKLKVQVSKDTINYYYDMPSTGDPVVFPLQFGNGSYSVTVLEQVQGEEYAQILSQPFEVTLEDEFVPFEIPMQLSYYTQDSAVVKKAFELSSGCDTDLAVLENVYEFLKDNIVYDQQKALAPPQGYIPNPDETLATGKGICYDFASLATALLRANGIPTKLVTGNVSPNGVYHAWNLIYLQNEGWVGKEIYVNLDTWQIIDTTFAAGMTDEDIAKFIGNGTNYTERYFY